ncbi:hypothetical protein DFH09DRAFT_1079293 [Mycena vulgaris]|nr:hypothetical protein DFH09DRAFT_1079293 [Mycena vulgaris]
MAAAVWETLKKYGLDNGQASVLAAMMDNASNNDTLVAALEVKFKSVGITWWDALEARMRCFPHTTHLAVLKLLEAIGAVERPDPKKRGVYQDNYTAGVDTPPFDANVL